MMDYEHGPTPTQLKVEYLLAEAGKQITQHMQAERVRVVTRNERLEAALRGVLASATPNPRDNPAMAAAWKIATDTLNPPNS
jgi:hypothetical protein